MPNPPAQHCWADKKSSSLSPSLPSPSDLSRNGEVNVFAFRGRWVVGLAETTMSPTVQVQQHHQQQRQRRKQQQQMKGQLAWTYSSSYRRHSCPDLHEPPRGSGCGDDNGDDGSTCKTTSPSGQGTDDDDDDDDDDVGPCLDDWAMQASTAVAEVAEVAVNPLLVSGTDVAADLARTGGGKARLERGEWSASSCQGHRGVDDDASSGPVAESTAAGVMYRNDTDESGDAPGVPGVLHAPPPAASNRGLESEGHNGSSLKITTTTTTSQTGATAIPPSPSSSSSCSSSCSSCRSSSSPSSSCPSPFSPLLFTERDGAGANGGGVSNNDDIVEPLKLHQTETSPKPVSRSVGPSLSSSPSSPGDTRNSSNIISTAKYRNRAGRGRRPASLLEDDHQQQQQLCAEEECLGGPTTNPPQRPRPLYQPPLSPSIHLARGNRVVCKTSSSSNGAGGGVTLLLNPPHRPSCRPTANPLEAGDTNGRKQQHSHRQVVTRSDFNQGLLGYASHENKQDRPAHQCYPPCSDESQRDDGDDGTSTLLLRDEWLLLQGFGPVPGRGQDEGDSNGDSDGDSDGNSDSGGFDKQEETTVDRSQRAAHLVGRKTSLSPAAPQQQQQHCRSLHGDNNKPGQESLVLKVIDTNIGRPATATATAATSDRAGGVFKTTPARSAYLRRAWLNKYDSAAASSCGGSPCPPFVGTAIRLAGLSSVASTTADSDAAATATDGHPVPRLPPTAVMPESCPAVPGGLPASRLPLLPTVAAACPPPSPPRPPASSSPLDSKISFLY
ncbi:unnamed protein product, partial [Pylaiella littoralis]